MSDNPKRFYEFGQFRLDASDGQLWLGGEEVPLTHKALKVLTLLVESGGRLVEKDELIGRVWPDAIVEENRLADNVSTLRKALGDDPKAPQYIKTVQGRGYRFLADVRRCGEEGFGLPPPAQVVLTARSTRTQIVIEEEVPDFTAAKQDSTQTGGDAATALLPAARVNGRSRLFAAACVACVALAALAAAAYYFRRAPAPVPGGTQQFRSLAVLPLRQLGAFSGDDEYLGQGLADALITKLSNVRQIVVRPTSAVLKYGVPGAARPDLVAVAREQQVDAVLDGSFQRAGERLRVTVQLVRAADGSPLWAETFDERLTDIFAVQDAISARVTGALRLKLSEEEEGRVARKYTENTEAYRLYLLGRFFWNKRTAQGFERAADYYRQAVAADPDYALAHAGLAETYVLLPNWLDTPPDEAYPAAERAAMRALELDPRLAEAYTALASVKIYHHRDWAGAGADYRRAIELNPNYATARQWYSEWLAMTGRLEEAVAEGALAQRLDPLSPIITFEHGVMLYFAGRLEDAEAQMRKALELHSGMFRPHVFLSRIYFDRGLIERSVKERALLLAQGDEARRARYEATLLAAYRAGGREGYLRRQVELCALPEMHHDHRVGGRVESCARLGDKDCAFAALDEAERVRHPIVDLIKVDPYFDSLRSDPRYAELMRRLKLPL
ncbi:MAG TPA: winged helix-turn-helix domain-containing protein [Pyrinomonadaceae bacterium]|nr:winged helix-turn-helix domain-containing protein [Pyrinomonadaceae bacterium]